MKTKTGNSDELEKRVLVLMPTGRDAELVCATLEKAGITAEPCLNAQKLEGMFAAGAGAVLIAEEALQDGTLGRLIESFNQQPIWSDVPVVLFAGNGQNAETLLATVGSRFNATIVERPIRITMLVSAVRAGLRARERQYQTRDLLNQLKESDRQKDLFLATLSHELRTPLNSILGWIQLLRNGAKQIDAKQALDVIERNAKAQSEMIDDILFISRVITGKLILDSSPVDLISVVQTAISTVRPSLAAKEIGLKTLFASGDLQIEGDANRLRQIFLNLLSNAIKFTPRQGEIKVSVAAKNSNVEVQINDSGQGIKPEFLPFVFERFRQADNSYTREIGGLGLGLAIVHHLTELHGGTVKVESDGENRGATFTVTFPLLPQMHASTAEKKEIESHQNTNNFPARTHVLLVEDDKDSREMLKIMFEHNEMEITAVDSAAEALQVIKQVQPDILISDVGLPGEDGYELMLKVRELTPQQGGQIPAIALTGYASLQDRDRAFDVGYQEHLPKPVDIDNLLNLVKRLIAQYKLTKHDKTADFDF